MPRTSLYALFLLLSAFALPAAAEEAPHPAEVVSTSFLKAVANHEWAEAAKLVSPEALERQKGEYLVMIRRAPSLETEEELLGRLGLTRLREVEALSAIEFYIKNREAVEVAKALSEAVQKKMKESFSLKVMGTMVEEEDALAFVLTRTSHETLDAAITERILLAVEKDKESGSWLVSPNRLQMDIRRLETAEGAPEEKKGE